MLRVNFLPLQNLPTESDDFQNISGGEFSANKKRFQCLLCPYSSNWKGNLNKHVSGVHSTEKPFKCTYCDYKTARKDCLKTHIISKHYV